MNEIANVCDKVGADVAKVAEIIGSDPRIGKEFLNAGIGYGGSCFPKDTRALQYIANTKGYSFKLLSSVIEVNNDQRLIIISKLKNILTNLQGKKIAVMGLTFKPGTDDFREAPSIPIVQQLIEEGAEVWAHDPIAIEKAQKFLPKTVMLSDSIENIFINAEAAILLTEWRFYRELSWNELGKLMKNKILIDGRNSLDSRSLKQLGFEYWGIGRK
nr:nucleotide sugar dehydrogenase [Desulforamulus aquiferis]